MVANGLVRWKGVEAKAQQGTSGLHGGTGGIRTHLRRSVERTQIISLHWVRLLLQAYIRKRPTTVHTVGYTAFYNSGADNLSVYVLCLDGRGVFKQLP